MSENNQKRPVKGILKNSSSFDNESHSQPSNANFRKSKETKWDEMNIIATLHPPGKDYGHMKIDEPKTPYNYSVQDHVDGLNARELAEKIKLSADKPPKIFEEDDDDDDSDEEELTEEERQKRREFELKRKTHYNEFYALQLAKKLLEEDEEDDDDEEDAQKGAKYDCGAEHKINVLGNRPRHQLLFVDPSVENGMSQERLERKKEFEESRKGFAGRSWKIRETKLKEVLDGKEESDDNDSRTSEDKSCKFPSSSSTLFSLDPDELIKQESMLSAREIERRKTF